MFFTFMPSAISVKVVVSVIHFSFALPDFSLCLTLCSVLYHLVTVVIICAWCPFGEV